MNVTQYEPGRYVWAYKVLRDAFGFVEFDKLSNTDAALIARDFLDAYEEDGTESAEYARRIGAGNLQAYADVMRVHFKSSRL